MNDQAQRQDVAIISPPRLPYHPAIYDRFGVDKSAWKALTEAIFPAAKTADAVLLALSYCKARNLDPFKRPVHIVPIWSSATNSMSESVWPGVNELRTTAHRTGQYAGIDETLFGDPITKTFKGRVKDGKEWVDKEITLTFPSFARITVWRIVAGQRVAFVGPRVMWLSIYSRAGGKNNELPNDRWTKDASYMLEKCAEAAALRRAFPEELGNEYTAEEMEGKVVDRAADNIVDVTPPPRPTRGDAKPPTESDAARGHAEMDRAGSDRMPDDEPQADAETGEVKEPEKTADAPKEPAEADAAHKFSAIIGKGGAQEFEDVGAWQAALLKVVELTKTVDGLDGFRKANAEHLAAASAAGWGGQAAAVSDAISGKIERLKAKK